MTPQWQLQGSASPGEIHLEWAKATTWLWVWGGPLHSFRILFLLMYGNDPFGTSGPHTRWRLPPKVFGPDSEDSPGGRARRFKSVNFKNLCNTGCSTSVYVNSFPVQNTWTNCLSFIRVTSRAYQVSPWGLVFGRVFPCKQADFPLPPHKMKSRRPRA